MMKNFSISKFTINPFDDSNLATIKQKLLYVVDDNGEACEFYKGCEEYHEEAFIQTCKARLDNKWKEIRFDGEFRKWFAKNVDISGLKNDDFKRYVIKELLRLGDYLSPLDDRDMWEVLIRRIIHPDFLIDHRCEGHVMGFMCILKAYYYGDF